MKTHAHVLKKKALGLILLKTKFCVGFVCVCVCVFELFSLFVLGDCSHFNVVIIVIVIFTIVIVIVIIYVLGNYYFFFLFTNVVGYR